MFGLDLLLPASGGSRQGCTVRFFRLLDCQRGQGYAQYPGQEKETKINFQLYPNPATSKVIISNPEFRNASVEIFNVAGKKVVEEIYPSEGDLKISTETWPVGLYIVKVTAKGKVYNQKLVVSH